MYKTSLITILLLFLYSIVLIPQTRYFPVSNYNTRSYGYGEGTIWSVAQDKRGMIYAGTANGVLEFDGHTWKFIKVKDGAWILSLAVDPSGLVLVGSQGEFGYLAPDNSGSLFYHSLSNYLGENSKYFGNIWKIHITGFGSVYQAEERLFICNDSIIKEIVPETSFHLSFYTNDTLYVRERGIGLMKYANDNLVTASAEQIFRDYGIFAMLPYDNKTLIVTQEKGLWVYERTGRIDQLELNQSEFIDNQIYGGIVLKDGCMAFNTLKNGVLITDLTQNKQTIINNSCDIASNKVNHIMQDMRENIWLATDKGISIIDYSSPLSYYKEKSGLSGNVRSIIRFNGKLFIGTSEGLFVQNPVISNNNINQFVPVNNFRAEVLNMVVAENDLLVSTINGFYNYSDNRMIRISNLYGHCIYYSKKEKMFILGGNKGIEIFKKEKDFKLIKRINEITENIISVKENKSYNNGLELWFGTSYQGLMRLRIDDKLNYRIEHFSESEGLPRDWILPFEYEGKVLFGTQIGLFSFKEDTIRLRSNSAENDSLHVVTYFQHYKLSDFNLFLPVYNLTDAEDKIWLSVDNEIKYIDKEHNNQLVYQPFLGIRFGKINTFYPDGNTGICWIGAEDGVIRYDESYQKDYEFPYYCFIRKAKCGVDSVLFNGTFFSMDNRKHQVIEFGQTDDSKPVLPYKLNFISFEFAAPFFREGNNLLYSNKLEGLDTTWSGWTSNVSKEYTNLSEGKYKFIVKAKNLFGVESRECYYSFVILPPWYRTIWAYILYFLLLSLVIIIAVKLGQLRLQAKNRILELKVQQRSAQIQKQKDEIEKQKDKIEKQNILIKESIRYAQHIQQAVQPLKIFIDEIVPDYFIFLKPCEIVSGDFYWIGRKNNLTLVAAVDGTGHGVPGAFINMLGIALLNEILSNLKPEEVAADIILNTLRKKVIKTLHQRGEEGEIHDGMDLALCIFDFDNLRLQYSGAYNPLYLFRNEILTEIKADSMPIGIHVNDTIPFSNNTISLEKNDIIYIFSDGYVSQFGGPDGNEKFKRKKFKDLLSEIHTKPLQEQQEILETRFNEWKGSQEQTDDVLVIALRIPT
jgi:serine phosphatase RsbU (regulator of sigma subunit)/ligand-binding sensor domain-containing protein